MPTIYSWGVSAKLAGIARDLNPFKRRRNLEEESAFFQWQEGWDNARDS